MKFQTPIIWQMMLGNKNKIFLFVFVKKIISFIIFRIKIEEFREHLPTVHTLGNPGMKVRHWEKVSEIVGFPITIDDSLTLEKIIDYGLNEYIPKFEIISEAATKENTLEQNLDKMMKEWEELIFAIHSYRLE